MVLLGDQLEVLARQHVGFSGSHRHHIVGARFVVQEGQAAEVIAPAKAGHLAHALFADPCHLAHGSAAHPVELVAR